MPPKDNAHSDSKLLLAVAGVVVLGAVGVALVAGLTVQPDEETSGDVTVRQSTPTRTRPPAERPPARPRVEQVSLETISERAVVVEPDPPVTDPTPVVEPSSTAIEIDPDADPWREGNRAYHERDYARAAAYFGADADARPERAYTQYMLGLALWKSGELDGALEAMQRSVELNDQSIKSFINLSRIQNARGEFEDARSAAERALTIDAENPTALYQLARSQYNLGRVEEALATLEACIELDQAAAEAHNLLGLVRLQAGEDSEALRSFEMAAALKPDVAYIQNNLGLAFERSGRLDEAVVALRRAVQIDAEHEAAAVSLARIEALLPPETIDGNAGIELADAQAEDPVVAEADGTEKSPVEGSDEQPAPTDEDASHNGGASSD